MEAPFSDILLILLILLAPGLLFFRKEIARRVVARSQSLRKRPVKAFYRQVLASYFQYYQKLDSDNKRRFETRVQAFIDSNEFIPRGFSVVSDEVKVMIAGAAVQLSFGIKHLNFAHFSKILVYPDDYYSNITRKYHQGEVNPRGLIVLSWKSFVSGYKDPRDGRNLALHEMAHALRLENAIFNEEFKFIRRKDLEHFDRLAEREIARIQQGQSSFFRDYSASNPHEFFAVAVENFFERPRLFLEEQPGLYHALTKVLNQDPLRLFGERVVPKNQ